MQGASTSGDYAVVSATTATDCADGGSTPPSAYFIVGRFSTSTSSGGDASVYVPAGYLASTGGGGGGVSSVGLVVGPSSGAGQTYAITGSPVTTSGTLTATLISQSANVFFSGPSSGSAAAPTWRALAYADLTSTYSVYSPSVSSSISLTLSSGGQLIYLPITANTTISFGSTAVPGAGYTFLVCPTGAFSLTWPSGIHGHMTIDGSMASSTCAAQHFTAYTSSLLYADAAGIIGQ
jgi:hypothetical protein